MSSYTENQISAARRILCNPYAFIEELEKEESTPIRNKPVTSKIQDTQATSDQVQASRKLLQNQYSHLGGDGDFEGVVKSWAIPQELTTSNKSLSKQSTKETSERKAVRAPQRYSEKQIQNIARQIQVEIWKDKDRFWSGAPPKDPIELLNPSHAISLRRYSLEYVPGFGQIIKDRDIAEIAGYLDNDRRKVYVSEQFSSEQMLFTAAHELGHILLHRDSIGHIHRDRPVDGAIISRDHVEWAADKFATFFLMPENLVRRRFIQRFRTKCLYVTEEAAFGLGFLNTDELRKKIQNKEHLAQLVASTTNYHTNHFKSLAAQFRVSVGSMAIRLKELELINY